MRGVGIGVGVQVRVTVKVGAAVTVQAQVAVEVGVAVGGNAVGVPVLRGDGVGVTVDGVNETAGFGVCVGGGEGSAGVMRGRGVDDGVEGGAVSLLSQPGALTSNATNAKRTATFMAIPRVPGPTMFYHRKD